MKNSDNTLWIVGAVLVSALVAVLAYFFAISPQLDGAAEAREATESAVSFNDQLDIQILGQQKKEKEVPTWRGTMAAIAVDLPPTIAQSDLDRFLINTLEDNKVPVVSIEYGAPTIVTTTDEGGDPSTPGVAPSPEPTPSPTPEPTDGATPEPSASPEPPAGGDGGSAADESDDLFQGLLAIPVTITTEGDPTGIMKTIRSIGTTDLRFLTITNLSIAKSDLTEESPGRPELTEDDWVSTVTFMAFLLYQDGVTLVPEEPAINPPYNGGKITNPFKPLPGTEQTNDSEQ